MKLLTLIAMSLLPAATSLAASPADSWAQLRSDRSVSRIEQGAYAGEFGTDGFFNACLAGEELRSIRPLKICVEGHWVHHWGMGGRTDEFVCTQEGTRDVVLPLNRVEQRCVQMERHGGVNEGGEDVCVKYEAVNVRISTSQNFNVYREVRAGQEQGGSYDQFLFSKVYEIPACN